MTRTSQAPGEPVARVIVCHVNVTIKTFVIIVSSDTRTPSLRQTHQNDWTRRQTSLTQYLGRMKQNSHFCFYSFECTGTTVIVEKAFASILAEEFKESHCHHCLHWTPGPVPCHQCSQVTFFPFLFLILFQFLLSSLIEKDHLTAPTPYSVDVNVCVKSR